MANLGFSRCPILICTTNVQCVVVPESAKPVQRKRMSSWQAMNYLKHCQNHRNLLKC